jgi:hypothetical protein
MSALPIHNLSALERGATAKRQTAIDDLFEHFALLLSGIDFSIAVGGALQLDIHLRPVANTADVGHPAVMAAIERIGDPQNSGKGGDCVTSMAANFIWLFYSLRASLLPASLKVGPVTDFAFSGFSVLALSFSLGTAPVIMGSSWIKREMDLRSVCATRRTGRDASITVKPYSPLIRSNSLSSNF